MTGTLLFVAVVVFAFLAGRAFERFASRLLVLSGAEYAVLGALLGPILREQHLGPDDVVALDLLISTTLGVVGFFVGLRIRQAKAGSDAIVAGLAASLGVIVVVGVAMTETLELLEPGHAQAEPVLAESIELYGYELWLWVTPVALWVGLTVGAAAGGSSSAVVDIAIARFGVSEARGSFLRGMAAAAELSALFAFGMSMAASRATASAGALGLTVTEWALVTILAGACAGFLCIVFLGREEDAMRMNVATMGVVIFAAGVGAALGVSPLLVNLIAGLTVALGYPHAARLEAAFRPLHFPISVLVLLFAGITWVPASGVVWALVPGYAVLRVSARRVFSRIAAATFVTQGAMAHGAGRGLIAQGVVAGAISLAFAQRYPDMAPVVTTTILGGMLLTDLFATRSLRRYLADVGEVHPLSATHGGDSR